MLTNQHGKEQALTEGNRLFKTTNQGVARSSRAGCTKGINDLRQTPGSAAFILCLSWLHKNKRAPEEDALQGRRAGHVKCVGR